QPDHLAPAQINGRINRKFVHDVFFAADFADLGISWMVKSGLVTRFVFMGKVSCKCREFARTIISDNSCNSRRKLLLAQQVGRKNANKKIPKICAICG
ncbi:MAG: hypothetical protein KDE34_29355, partial [Anaerolineales bacterium]|nr:hypothetical protein [Anaerolineales bacterium]